MGWCVRKGEYGERKYLNNKFHFSSNDDDDAGLHCFQQNHGYVNLPVVGSYHSTGPDLRPRDPSRVVVLPTDHVCIHGVNAVGSLAIPLKPHAQVKTMRTFTVRGPLHDHGMVRDSLGNNPPTHTHTHLLVNPRNPQLLSEDHEGLHLSRGKVHEQRPPDPRT